MVSQKVVTVVPLFPLLGLTSALFDGFRIQDRIATIPYAASATIRVPDIDIDDVFIQNALTENLQESIRIVENVKSLPSCPKIATSALMHTCSALEGTINEDESTLVKGFDLFIEEEATIYATRLAICELNDARFNIPPQCASFVPTDRMTKKRSIRGFWLKDGPSKPTSQFQYYDDVTKANLEHCRKALAATPQSWTSYSNNRQNANMLCRAMRSEIEKDQQIHLSKILAAVTADAAEALHEKVRLWEEAKPLFQHLAKSMPEFHEALAQNERQLMKIRDLWEDILPRSQEVLHTMGQQNTRLKEADSVIYQILTRANELVSTMQSASVQQEQGSDALSMQTDEISKALQFLAAMVQDGVIQSVGFATQDLNALKGQVQQAQEDLAEWKETTRKLWEEDLKEHRKVQEITSRLVSDINNTMPSVQKMETVLLAAEARLENLQSIFWAQVAPLLRFTFYFYATFAFWYHFTGLALLASTSAALASAIVLSMVDITALGAILAGYVEAFSETQQLLLLALFGFAIGITGILAIRSKLWSRSKFKNCDHSKKNLLRDPGAFKTVDCPKSCDEALGNLILLGAYLSTAIYCIQEWRYDEAEEIFGKAS